MVLRLSLRRGFLYLLATSCVLFLLVNLRHQREVWLGPYSSSSASSGDPRLPPPPAPPPPPPHQQQQQQQAQAAFQGAAPDAEDEEMAEDEAEAGGEGAKAAAKDQAGRSRRESDSPDGRGEGAEDGLHPTLPPPEERPWFMEGGKRRPRRGMVPDREVKLWPEEDPGGDRIVEQLMFIPRGLPVEEGEEDGGGAGNNNNVVIGDNNAMNNNLVVKGDEDEYTSPPPPPSVKQHPPLKKILVFGGLGSWSPPLRPGREAFLSPTRCPVSTCSLTGDRAEAPTADAVLFRDASAASAVAASRSLFPRPRDQVWVLYFLECPYHTPHLHKRGSGPGGGVFNWTATYRRDSDLVAPYEKWVYYDEKIKEKPQPINYAANKTKMVAWFVSNCGARNGRLQYAQELAKHVEVDVYGACGSKRCPRSSPERCFRLLDRDYKFYLAFENSNCKDYITEKFFVNGLGHNILPIAMGARPEDYARSAPRNSFLHVEDFNGPADLAAHLKRLDADDAAYNAHFRWKGTGEFVNTHFLCRLCALLHDDRARAGNGRLTLKHRSYEDINRWWRGPGVCTSGTWKNMGKGRE
ncbi:glycoprotein 3-alpha-L-fucosyltransferase A isoform X2 [Ischnura elegans]|uniref:glycoprotein 3-alpha-L-fucosyltransferase A isoform X2 n=1 Tax=Ischnura elegans TaxID=197161 RepID=UPI001ED875CF|nr:glycoprotein 3-alpha-L-fucosyltransferase A isoform X2 [Ischnura elegans]